MAASNPAAPEPGDARATAAPHSAGASSRRRSASRASTNGYDPVHELKAAANNLGEVAAYIQQLIAAKVSRMLYGVRKLAMLSMLGAVVGIAGISILVTCAVLLVMGVAGGIEALLPAHLDWLGMLIVGFTGILISFLAVYIVLRRATAVGKRMALEQYRTALHEQRKRFGHDAFSRSAAHAAEEHLKVRRSRTRTQEEIQALREQQVRAEKAQRQMEEDFARIKGK